VFTHARTFLSLLHVLTKMKERNAFLATQAAMQEHCVLAQSAAIGVYESGRAFNGTLAGILVAPFAQGELSTKTVTGLTGLSSSYVNTQRRAVVNVW
jgi:hypothetical protein